MDLNYKVLSEKLQGLEDYSALVRYIFRVQGDELRRLDYQKAARALGISRRTVSRYITKLADYKIITLNGDKLKLNNEILSR